MKVIITGATGFVGQNLSQYLISKSIDVEQISLRQQNWKENINLQANAIIHLAGKAHDTANTSAEEEYFRINRDLTKLLFNEFLRSEISDFLYFSSVKAVADTVEGVLTEDVIGEPLTAYGKSKLEAENFLLSQKLPEGKRVFIIRPCIIHGPCNKGNLNLLFKIVEKGIPWPLGAFENKRSFLSIDNLNFIIYQILMNEDIESGIYNFADDQAISTNNLIQIITKTLDKKSRLWKIPQKYLEITARMGDKFHLPLNSERLKKLTESYVVSNQKIKSAIKVDSLPITTEQGLIKTIKSFIK
ncbi:dehydratase [Chryseobacterium piperi]|uniref:Dehydratase n=1 Tax=Chryseobacterium piperi TaxID=558152 RepID=A0A086BKB5_9FLAO|nr:NAD-dependent epimerase/dehydratase family protein [Chryseobacterium piperi]ASW76157.1 nucleoside-diphosphate-sugar epimerase [Chryseobacterium piperi]KFF29379.1 dehydratase [Chryseobacterium piperi]